MGDMLIRGIPDALKTEIESVSQRDGRSLSAAAIDLLRKGVAADRTQDEAPPTNAWEMLRSAFTQDGPPSGEYAAILDEIERERKQDFGRPFDFGDDVDYRP